MGLKCTGVLLLVNICSLLCTALHLTNGKSEVSRTRLFNKLFADEKRTNQGEWNRDERSMFAPSLTKSKFQPIHDQEMRKYLLRDILNLNERRLGEVKRRQYCGQHGCTTGRDESQEQAIAGQELNDRRMGQIRQTQEGPNDKREPGRCGFYGCKHKGDEPLKEDADGRRALLLAIREPGHAAQMSEMDLNDVIDYDMELEKQLRDLEDSRPYIAPRKM